ncbi:MAG: hypothetical protein ABJO67_16760 [Pseudoruegeria sp.]
MKELISKLSSYNLFNYLLPGALFVFICRYLELLKATESNIVLEFFVYYFAGMTISRVGSLIVEPLFKRIKLVSYAEYPEYLDACKRDDKIEILLEQNNVYRTIVALFFSVLPLQLAVAYGVPNELLTGALLISVFILYVLAYRKQTSYIRQRVEKNKNR